MWYNTLRNPKGVNPMNRSVYSLVLMDDVIKAADRRAYELGTSRSNLINQILAESLGCLTPEMRMREIFASVCGLIDDSFRVQQQRSDSLLTLKTALEYKYRPTINYKVELVRAPDEFLGTLRVHIRTQSQQLISLFNSFFVYRMKLEADMLSLRGYDNYVGTLSSGCFTRNLLNTFDSENDAARAISGYISDLDNSLKAFFAAPGEFPMSASMLENRFARLLDNYII